MSVWKAGDSQDIAEGHCRKHSLPFDPNLGPEGGLFAMTFEAMKVLVSHGPEDSLTRAEYRLAVSLLEYTAIHLHNRFAYDESDGH